MQLTFSKRKEKKKKKQCKEMEKNGSEIPKDFEVALLRNEKNEELKTIGNKRK